MKLLLVRHGETQWNREGRALGRGEQRLTDAGREQASAVARVLSRENIEAIYSSPLKRALETAKTIGLVLGLPVNISEELVEVDAGELEGLTSEEMRTRNPDFMALWDRDPGNTVMPGGESLSQVQERIWRLAQCFMRERPEANVAAVSHNFPIQTVICKALGLPLSAFRNLRVDLASISALELHQDRVRLVLLNDVCHLAVPSADDTLAALGKLAIEPHDLT